MDGMLAIVYVAALFVLRLAVPLLIVLAVGFWLRQMDARWQVQAQAGHATKLAKQAVESDMAIEMFGVIQPPCWMANDCTPTDRKQCPGFRDSSVPCWLARFRADGKLPARCYGCNLFAPRKTENPSPVRVVAD